MDLKARLDKELRNAGRRCVNVIPGEKGPRACGNPINRYSEFEVCNACKIEGRGEAMKTLRELQRRKRKRTLAWR